MVTGIEHFLDLDVRNLSGKWKEMENICDRLPCTKGICESTCSNFSIEAEVTILGAVDKDTSNQAVLIEN